MSCIPPCSVLYFHGRLSREEAETVLMNNGCTDGLFLLRESLSVAGNYAVSICHRGLVHHYSIERQPDGTVRIQDGKPFPGPVELVQHHQIQQDGFLTKPTSPLNLPPGQSPQAWPGVSMLELEQALVAEADRRGLQGEILAQALGPKRQQFVSAVARELHKEQPWFHGDVSREEAENIIKRDKHKDGKYLVRERANGELAISLSHKNHTKHYRIHIHPDGRFGIADGPKFYNIMDLVGHYYNKPDGMLCKLSMPCVKAGYKKKKLVLSAFEKNIIYGTHQPAVEEAACPGPPLLKKQNSRPLPPTPNALMNMSTAWDQPEPVASRHRSTIDVDQQIYDALPVTEDLFNLKADDLELQDELGAGCFGSVMKGVFKRRGGQKIPVAVKTLKSGEYQAAEDELLREARVMADLKHKHIVRMIGVCRGTTIMLLLELAPLGPLNKFLKRDKNLPISKILHLMYQVALGMEYLESRNFVHRDLAARNVLLVDDKHAKISDFGMSKALGLDDTYYQAENAGRWPLKWYAPECIWYWKFDSKSDVWSYGVTLWEATSNGEKPYKGMRGQQIIDMIENGERMAKPSKCPDEAYNVMLQCWELEKDMRPTFKKVADMMKLYK